MKNEMNREKKEKELEELEAKRHNLLRSRETLNPDKDYVWLNKVRARVEQYEKEIKSLKKMLRVV